MTRVQTWSGQDPWEVYQHVTETENGLGSVTIGLNPRSWEMVAGHKVETKDPFPVRIIATDEEGENVEAYLTIEDAEELLRDLQNVIDHAHLDRDADV